MEHGVALIASLAWGMTLSLIFGYLATKLRMPALVGYLLAGIAIAPTTPGFVGEMSLAGELSEVGVMLLMFGVGLHFSVRDLLRVKNLAVPGALLQMGFATAIGMAVAHFLWDWSLASAFILGLSLSCASTVVLLKSLDSRGALETGEGQVAVGWLVVEDMITVFLLVILPSIGAIATSGGGLDAELGYAVLKTFLFIAAFIVLMLFVVKKVLNWILIRAVQTGSHEIFTLCVIAIAIGIAYAASEIFKVSFALGAFFAGMVLRESEYAHRAATDSLPLQDAFSVIFFLGVGMLFDPKILVDEPLKVLMVVGIIVLGKSFVATSLVKAMGYSWRYALTIGAALSQVGEFSFILASLGMALGLLPHDGMTLILAGAIISIAVNPLVFQLVDPILARVEVFKPLPDPVVFGSQTTEGAKGPAIVIGAGTMGRQIYETLMDKGISTFVIEKNATMLTKDEQQRNFILGDATLPQVLERVYIEQASVVILTLYDAITSRKIVEEIRKLNADVRIFVLLATDDDRTFFKDVNGEFLENIQPIDTHRELAKNVLFYCVNYYRRL